MTNRRQPKQPFADCKSVREQTVRTPDVLQIVLVASQIALVCIGAYYTVETSRMRKSMDKQLSFMWEQSRLEASPAIVPTIARHVRVNVRPSTGDVSNSRLCRTLEIEADINNASQNNAHAVRVIFFDRENATYRISPRVEPVVPPGRSPGWDGGDRCMSGPELLAELTYSYRTAPEFFASHLQDEGSSFVAVAFRDDIGDQWLVRQTFEIDGKGAVQYYAARDKPSYMGVRYGEDSTK